MERRLDIDISKGIVILCVVLGHLNIFDKFTYNLIFSFHMPFFFIMSGYCTSERSLSLRFSEYLKKNIKGLLIPSIIIRIVWIFMLYNVHNFADFEDLMLFSHTEWFLGALFISKLLFWLYKRIPVHNKYFDITAAILSFCIANLINNLGYHLYPRHVYFPYDCAFVGLAFIIIGSIAKTLNLSSCIITSKKVLIFVITFMVAAYIVYIPLEQHDRPGGTACHSALNCT